MKKPETLLEKFLKELQEQKNKEMIETLRSDLMFNTPAYYK